jgi:hypothetical protein
VTFAAGTKLTGCSQGEGGIVNIQGTGALVQGGEMMDVMNGNPSSGIRIRDGSTNPTLDGSTANGPIILHDEDTCLLTGPGDGTITVKDLIVYKCGNGNDSGQDHNIYFSTNGTASDNTVVNVAGIRSYDVLNGGWTLKMRPGTSTITGDATNYFIGCQRSGDGCEQNGAIDFPCGGIHTDMVIERGPGGDNWFIARSNEETANPIYRGCPYLGYPTTNVTFDNVVMIWDGPAPGAGSPGNPALCMGGATCAVAGASNTGCIKNSILVGDFANSGLHLTMGPGVTDCGAGGHTNKVFDSRAAAAAALRWSGIDQFGNPCCAFPWVPSRP